MLFFSSPSSSPKKFTRLKREDYHRTQHDSVFSSWEILIGDCDWEDYHLGKDGAQRYRIHNLPNGSSCPGLYELGITVVPKRHDGHKSRKHRSKNIIVVYLGQTNNVRTRLQKYGRVGAHLDAGKVAGSAANDGINECPGLFKKVFSRGYSIMFRWAPMIDKKKAEKTEADLLNVFDYAWNTCGNSSCRSNEIFQKLDSKSSRKAISIVKKFHFLKDSAFSRKAGIKIDASVPSNITKANKSFLLPHVLKFRKSQLQFVNKKDTYCNNNEICGVAIGNGSVCKNMPRLGKKRCEGHKGKKIVGMDSVVVIASQTHQESTVYKTRCGLLLEDGCFCANVPAYGRKRCELHRGMRNKLDIIRNTPKVEPDLIDEKETSVKNCSSVQSLKADDKDDNWEEEHVICGVVDGDGTKCRKNPVSGRKRCEEHKGRKVFKMALSNLSIKILKNTDDLVVCSACMEDGSTCMEIPVRGRKRCELHKGRKVKSGKLNIF